MGIEGPIAETLNFSLYSSVPHVLLYFREYSVCVCVCVYCICMREVEDERERERGRTWIGRGKRRTFDRSNYGINKAWQWLVTLCT